MVRCKNWIWKAKQKIPEMKTILKLWVIIGALNFPRMCLLGDMQLIAEIYLFQYSAASSSSIQVATTIFSGASCFTTGRNYSLPHYHSLLSSPSIHMVRSFAVRSGRPSLSSWEVRSLHNQGAATFRLLAHPRRNLGQWTEHSPLSACRSPFAFTSAESHSTIESGHGTASQWSSGRFYGSLPVQEQSIRTIHSVSETCKTEGESSLDDIPRATRRVDDKTCVGRRRGQSKD